MKYVPTKIPAFDALSPYNWDFRTVPEWALNDAIEYEYLRSHDAFRIVAEKWLETETLGKTARDHLMDHSDPKLLQKSKAKLYDLVTEIGHPNSFFICELLLHNCAYPAPWTWLFEKGVIKRADQPKRKFQLCDFIVNIDPMDKQKVEFVQKMLSFPDVEPTYGYHLKINFDAEKNEDLVKRFASWLAVEAKKKRKKNRQGNASATPHHKLKHLAAWRISNSGYKDFLKAQKFIEQKLRIFDMGHDILPLFSSKSGWEKAIKHAEAEMENFKNIVPI